MNWTVVFRDVGGSALFVPVTNAESDVEAIRLARAFALRHFSPDEVNAAKVETRPGHDGLDLYGLKERCGDLEEPRSSNE